MKVLLAGYNIDYDIIRDLRGAVPHQDALTPETIAAAYARISRSPNPVNELRSASRLEIDKARQSNRTIVFDMGHSSIAEHAVFNVDIIGVSRLLVEEIEKFRLCSYTEKSQRYVLMQDDFVIPEEIRRAGLEKPFIATIREQNRFYHELYAELRPHVFSQYPDLAADPKNRSLLEGWAKEDARYIISLATETQLGLTLNARNLELMLRRLAANPLAEAGLYSRKLYDATRNIAPSLIRYTEATDYDRLTRFSLREAAASLAAAKSNRDPLAEQESVVLFEATPHADDRILASLLHTSSRMSMSRCQELVRIMNNQEKQELIEISLRHLQSYDSVLREYELVDLHFELVVSASCFAQLKRHRMATLTSQDYDPALGVTIPPAVAAIGMDRAFVDVIDGTEEMYGRIQQKAPAAAGYILTNAHRKRVTLKVNARELYHMARLRTDRHAQWDIRDLTIRMLELGKAVMPLMLMLATGKDSFAARYEKIFSS